MCSTCAPFDCLVLSACAVLRRVRVCAYAQGVFWCGACAVATSRKVAPYPPEWRSGRRGECGTVVLSTRVTMVCAKQVVRGGWRGDGAGGSTTMGRHAFSCAQAQTRCRDVFSTLPRCCSGTHMHTHTHTHTHTRARARACTFHTHAPAHARMHARIHARARVCYAHAHTHTRTHSESPDDGHTDRSARLLQGSDMPALPRPTASACSWLRVWVRPLFGGRRSMHTRTASTGGERHGRVRKCLSWHAPSHNVRVSARDPN
jgi:hypothetical protein